MLVEEVPTEKINEGILSPAQDEDNQSNPFTTNDQFKLPVPKKFSISIQNFINDKKWSYPFLIKYLRNFWNPYRNFPDALHLHKL
uniref:Uncharacterized protein n=1 Tax=Lepeophtheirus salmonis TaxID=72036 RepID=A0A0K2UGP6_LEPSM